ncbi:MAG: class I SAM-dependent methyltransferase [Cyanobacteria bacterium J06558_2]
MNKPLRQNIFSFQADKYAAFRPQYPHQLYQYLVSVCRQRQQAWDCATGSGQCAIVLAEYFEQVHGTDISEAQIKYATPHQRIEYLLQAAEKTNFTDGQFDMITVAQAVHWFNLDEFWTEVRRVLKPGGIIAVWGYGWASITPEIDALVDELILKPIDTYWLPGNRLLINQYRDLDFPYEAIAPPKDFFIEEEWTRERFFNYMSTWSAMKRYLAQVGDRQIINAQHEIAQLWSDNVSKTVRMPIFLKVGIN